MMPKAARARGASPPAGTALARTIRECLPNRVRIMGEDGRNVTITETDVNRSVTRRFITAGPIAVILRCDRQSREPRRMSGPVTTSAMPFSYGHARGITPDDFMARTHP